MIILTPQSFDDILDYLNKGYVYIDISEEGIKYFRPKAGFQFVMPSGVPVVFKYDTKDPKKACILFQDKVVK